KLRREVALERCTFKEISKFFKKYNEEERNEILYGSDYETASLSTSSSFISTSSTSSGPTTKTTKVHPIRHTKSKPSKGLIIMDGHLDGPKTLKIVALFKFLNPNLKLPGRRALSGCILSLYSEELQRQHIVEAKKHETGNTLIFDSWKNASFQEILGSILITSKGKVLV
ncbi:947_t:CDS:2, partial [Gigaspora margarita]